LFPAVALLVEGNLLAVIALEDLDALDVTRVQLSLKQLLKSLAFGHVQILAGSLDVAPGPASVLCNPPGTGPLPLSGQLALDEPVERRAAIIFITIVVAPDKARDESECCNKTYALHSLLLFFSFSVSVIFVLSGE